MSFRARWMSTVRSESFARCCRSARTRIGEMFCRGRRSPGKYCLSCLHSSSSPNAASFASPNRGRSQPLKLLVTPLAKLLEAALFASAVPVPVDALRTMAAHADDGETTLESALAELRDHYDTDG